MGQDFRGFYGESFLRVRVVKQRVISAPFLLSDGARGGMREKERKKERGGVSRPRGERRGTKGGGRVSILKKITNSNEATR